MDSEIKVSNKLQKTNEKLFNRYKIIDRSLVSLAYLFLIVPIVILLMFWFKWYVSLICISFIAFSSYFVLKKFKYKTFEEYKKIFNSK